jgi:superkiller protein 3
MKEDLIFFLEKAFELNEGNEALCEKLIIECSYIRKNKLAMKYCNKCLEINPNNLIALLNLCKLNIRLDKVEEAREYCEKADKLYPNKLQVLVEKFSIYRKLRKWEECINIAQKIITHYPANATGYGCLAEAYYESVDYNLALEYYNKALEFEPKEIIYIQNKASCYEKMGKPEEAITILKEAINVNPENVESYKSIAFTYLKQKKYEEARDTYFFTINPATMDMERLNRVNIDSKFIK